MKTYTFLIVIFIIFICCFVLLDKIKADKSKESSNINFVDLERAYMKGQIDALNGDIRVQPQLIGDIDEELTDDNWFWIKSPWDSVGHDVIGLESIGRFLNMENNQVKRKMIFISKDTAVLLHLFVRKPELRYTAEDFWFMDEGIEPNLEDEARVAAKEFISQLHEEYNTAFILELMKECYNTLKRDDKEFGSNIAEKAFKEIEKINEY